VPETGSGNWRHKTVQCVITIMYSHSHSYSTIQYSLYNTALSKRTAHVRLIKEFKSHNEVIKYELFINCITGIHVEFEHEYKFYRLPVWSRSRAARAAAALKRAARY